MASSSSSSPEAARLEYVGFWKRLLAFLIDSMILTVVLVPLLLALYGAKYFSLEHQLSGAAGGVWDWLINLLLIVVTIVFWRYRGATPGKMAISAKIVDAATGRPASTGQLVGRFFAYIVSMLPLFLGFLWIGIDRRKQGFHDKLAGTAVVYDEDQFSAKENHD